MPNEYLFFLSYNREELQERELLNAMLEALTDSLRTATPWPVPLLGFRDTDLQIGDDWGAKLMEALSNCRVFVPLMHPRYFSKPDCGREWAAFARRQKAFISRNPGVALPSRIVPILWSREDDLRKVLPPVAVPVQYKQDKIDPRYAELGLAELMRTRPEKEWRAVVGVLARKIAEAAAADAVLLPPLDPGTEFTRLESAWSAPGAAITLPAGRSVWLLCDRTLQAGQFCKELPAQLTQSGCPPQAYLIHGDRFELPDSFIQRLTDVDLPTLLTNLGPLQRPLAEDCTSAAKVVLWPRVSSLPEAKDLLLQNLLGTFGGVAAARSPSAADLLDLTELKTRRLVTILHDIRPQSGDASFDLIEWYLDEFWAALPSGKDWPRVILLLAAIREPEKAPAWPLRLFRRSSGEEYDRRLGRIGASTKGCSRLTLPGLEPVTASDLRDWFAKYAVDPGPVARESWVTKILEQGRTRGLPPDQVNMDLVVQILTDMLKKQDEQYPLQLRQVA
jgi:hypothetical protein